jgi:radical SAM/Cys-rich protein
MDAADQLARLNDVGDAPAFGEKLQHPLMADGIRILQLNISRRCNLSCKHCHVQAGPFRSETMGRDILEKILDILGNYPIDTIDITGGAPEMNPHLPWFIEQVTPLQRRLMVRSNLLILQDPTYAHFFDLYVDNGIEIVTSLPDAQALRTDRQRGEGVFQRVIDVIRQFNAKGYGQPGSGLVIDLVFNPVGAYLPGFQSSLEAHFRQRLQQEHGVVFNHLFALANCPVGRYLEYLVRSDNFEDYMNELINAYNGTAVDNAMCRTTLSVGYDGTLYDCDFNQMLELAVDHGAPSHIDIFNFETLGHRQIVVANHCYACTAGAGSSCQGALEGC